jgi:hypothetical protein
MSKCLVVYNDYSLLITHYSLRFMRNLLLLCRHQSAV